MRDEGCVGRGYLSEDELIINKQTKKRRRNRRRSKSRQPRRHPQRPRLHSITVKQQRMPKRRETAAAVAGGPGVDRLTALRLRRRRYVSRLLLGQRRHHSPHRRSCEQTAQHRRPPPHPTRGKDPHVTMYAKGGRHARQVEFTRTRTKRSWRLYRESRVTRGTVTKVVLSGISRLRRSLLLKLKPTTPAQPPPSL